MTLEYKVKRKIRRLNDIESIPNLFDEYPKHSDKNKIYIGKINGNYVKVTWNRKSGIVLHALNNEELDQSYSVASKRVHIE